MAFHAYAFNFACSRTGCAAVERGQSAARSFQLGVGRGDAGASGNASELGDRRWNDRWTDRSPDAYARRDQNNHAILTKLAKIDRAQLSTTDQLNYDLFQKRYADRIEQYKVRWFLMSFNQREGPQTSDDLGSSLRFETVKDYEDWLARLRAVPTALDQFTALLREGFASAWCIRE